MMIFNEIILIYFKELREEFKAAQSGEATEELSFRTSLDNFFKNLTKKLDDKIVTIPEPKNQYKLGRPDWRFHNSESMGVYGYVEAKGLDSQAPLNISSYRSQISKYLSIGNPVILTDGVEFIFFQPNGSIQKYAICNKPIVWEKPILHFDVEIPFKKFFNKVGHRTISENQLVTEVSVHAKLLTNEIKDFLNLTEDETINQSELNTLRLLKSLKEVSQENHDKSLNDNDTFASFISQILTFGLLYAHRVIDKQSILPIEKYSKIHDFWFSVINEHYSEKLIPFKTLVQGLQSELDSDMSRLGLWYDDLRRLLSHIKLTESQLHIPDFHELYETFLTKYDPDVRFDYGAYYTPRVLAFYTVELVKKIIGVSFPDIKLNSSMHKFIDPCCGTGTFIEAILEQINPHPKSPIVGFEILPVPYALAHYRITLLKKEYPENIKIKLTNALSDTLFNNIDYEENIIGNILAKEQQEAYKLASPPLTLIIGNPPSSDSKFKTDNEGLKIKQLVQDFRPQESLRHSRQNIQKQLSNEFIKFLRWTVDRAIKSSPSIFALIIPSSFAKHPTYKYARKYLVENFNELWVLEFDSDNRTGVGDQNIFKTRQGRLILIGVHTRKAGKTILKYNSINKLSGAEKIDYFEKLNINLGDWGSLDLDEKNYVLKPQKDFDREIYKNFWPLTNSTKAPGIFLRHCSSLKLAPTHLLVHASSGQLKRRSKFIANNSNSYEDIKENWYSGQLKPPPKSKITEGIRERLQNSVNQNDIYDYSYRPFVSTKVLLNDDLLSELQHLGGGGTRDRPEIRAAFSNKDILAIAVSPAPEDLGDKLSKFSSFCWNIPDNDLSKRGNAHVFCNYFPEYKKKGQWDSKCYNNINNTLVDLLVSKFSVEKEKLINSIIFYCYAILSSPYYLEAFNGALYGVAGNWPSIPITKDKNIFFQIANYGKMLADIESSDYGKENFKVEPIELVYHKYRINENEIALISGEGHLVKEFKEIDTEVINFEISGYNVIKEWLKLHSYPYYRKPINGEDLIELKLLVQKIKDHIEITQDMDSIIEEVLESNNFIKPQ